MESIRDLMRGLTGDPWRSKTGFSTDLEEAHRSLACMTTKDDKADCINTWLGTGKNQPCLFGRVAARLGRVGYCVLDEDDLERDDTEIQRIIQRSRLEWVRRTYRGEQSAFVLLILAERIATALPNAAMRALAARIVLLYLQREPQVDQVMLEEAFLEIPGRDPWVLRWDAGVNYFSSQADGRWWHDHRIPGGFAFSVNSVGHLARATKVDKLLEVLNAELGMEEDPPGHHHVDTLPRALEFAMRTIDGAYNSVSGKATELIERRAQTPECPFALPAHLKDRDPALYSGHYHTDHTLPSVYFRPDVHRPVGTQTHELDFTYLWLRSPDNPAFLTMGEGVRVRQDHEISADEHDSKARRFVPEEIEMEQALLLRRAFEQEN